MLRETRLAVTMIRRNPAETLDQRPTSRRVLRALLDMDGEPATIEEIAERTGLTIEAVRGIMYALHGHRFCMPVTHEGVRRYTLTMKGLRPSLFERNRESQEPN